MELKLGPVTRARMKKLKASNRNKDNGMDHSRKQLEGENWLSVGEGHPTIDGRPAPIIVSRLLLVEPFIEFKIPNRGSSRKGGDPWEGVESKLQSKVDLHQNVEELKRGKNSATMKQIVGDNFGGVNSSHQRPYHNIGRRREGQGGRGYYRLHEEVPRHEAWCEDNLFDDFREDPNVPSFKGESDPNIFLNWERQVENLLMVRNYIDIVKVKLVIAEFSSYALH
ncbi:hypothetical protein M9H77_30136 [Catharanthus roseus]|uniref:Uncharacterized protein n=1 Tax=Catharanthus roseus TaxID=4058 RepID=A0ACB9ZYD3_CATRO|nr:hypothetical protein M9H77_30136 [Catharanthus roseus]